MPEPSCAAERGFTMPAEWETQRAILLSWPLNPATWEDRRNELEATYAGFVAAISRFEDVKINCVCAEQSRILKLLSEAGADAARVELLDVPTNDAWCRDHGPVCLVNRATRARLLDHFQYNAWGGKFPRGTSTPLCRNTPPRCSGTKEMLSRWSARAERWNRTARACS